jgi:hypothetical protein
MFVKTRSAFVGIASPQTLSRGNFALSINAIFSLLSFNASAQAAPAGPEPAIKTSKCLAIMQREHTQSKIKCIACD